MCSSTTSTPCWPSSSGQLVHQQHHPASFCWLGRVWQQGREKSGASTLREVLFSKADSPSWWPDEDLKQLTWKWQHPVLYSPLFLSKVFILCVFDIFLQYLIRKLKIWKWKWNKFRSETSLWLQWRDKLRSRMFSALISWIWQVDYWFHPRLFLFVCFHIFILFGWIKVKR